MFNHAAWGYENNATATTRTTTKGNKKRNSEKKHLIFFNDFQVINHHSNTTLLLFNESMDMTVLHVAPLHNNVIVLLPTIQQNSYTTMTIITAGATIREGEIQRKTIFI